MSDTSDHTKSDTAVESSKSPVADSDVAASEQGASDAQIPGADEQLPVLSDEEELARTIESIAVDRHCVEKDSNGTFGLYRVASRLSDGTAWQVWRRYSEFQALHRQLEAELGDDAKLPNLPGKRLFGSTSESTMSERQEEFNVYMAALATPCQRSLRLRAFLQPSLRRDWPAQVGALDLEVHDRPHESSATEWWYYNSHITGTDGRRLSLFLSFFRILKHVDAAGRKSYAHAVNWAVTDMKDEEYYAVSLVDPDSPAMIKQTLKDDERCGTGVQDPMLRRAMLEVLDRGNVPLPDRVFAKDPVVDRGTLDITWDGGLVRRTPGGAYDVHAHSEDGRTALRLRFSPAKKPVRHGRNGVVKGHDGDDMFYYFIPRCTVSGTVTVAGEEVMVSRGDGWYDHEFGGKYRAPPAEEEGTSAEEEETAAAEGGESPVAPAEAAGAGAGAGAGAKDEGEGAEAAPVERGRMEYAWSWVSAQLANEYEVTAAVLHDPRDMRLMETRAVVVDPKGNRVPSEDMTLEPLDDDACRWRSVRTFIDYPVAWRLRIPAVELDVTVTAAFPDQEFVSFIAKPAYWEGRCDVEGTMLGKPVEGLGFAERNGYDPLQTLSRFFKGVGAEVRKQLMNAYPDLPTYEQGRTLVAGEETEHYMTGVPLDRLSDTLLKPVRLIADRGGKSWRSYGALACCDVVGGDSRKYPMWLAMPEFMHVGSLIVDDIQDKSESRRGGPAAHHVFGEALCINSGTAAYFMAHDWLVGPQMTAEEKIRVYQLYFQALRAGHAGQALDISGLDYLMPDLVRTGDAAVAEERILAIHMLKTAAPAGSLARMGALVGGGTEEQIAVIGRYYESVGLAFQIMDDVLNLRGLYTTSADLQAGKKLKVVGEDITAGKVTIPVVKAMGILKDEEERRKLWETVQSKPEDQEVVARVIAQLEECGALDACVEQATTLVEEAWETLDAVVPDSFAKIMLRSFGWFVTERHR